MIPSNHEERLRVFHLEAFISEKEKEDFVGGEEGEGLDLLSTAIHVIAEEQEGVVHGPTHAVEDAQEVRVLAVDVRAHLQ